MKILVMSDSHDNIVRLRHVLGFAKTEKFDAVIHCGDWDSPLAVSEISKSGIKTYGVLGNADIDPRMVQVLFEVCEQFDENFLNLRLDDKKIGIHHFPTGLNDAILSQEYDILFCGHCFDENVEILTKKDGWKKGIDIRENEIVATMNLQTGLLEYNSVKEKVVYDHFKKLIRFKGRGYDISVTDQHSMVYAPCQGGHQKNSYQKYKSTKIWRKTEAINLLNRQGAVFIPLSVHNTHLDCNLTDDEIRLIGWLVSEGHFRKNGAIQLFQNIGEKSEIIESLLKRMDIKYTKYLRKFAGRNFNDPRTQKPYTTNKDSYAFYITVKTGKNILKYIKNKEIPNVLQECSLRQFSILLETLCLGDGTHAINKIHKGNTWVYYSKNQKLIDQLQELCVKNGYRSSARYRRNCWEITICNRGWTNLSGSSKKSYIPYSGKVWCVTVDNGTLIVRSNGKTIITGNTHKRKEEQYRKTKIINVGALHRTDSPCFVVYDTETNKMEFVDVVI